MAQPARSRLTVLAAVAVLGLGGLMSSACASGKSKTSATGQPTTTTPTTTTLPPTTTPPPTTAPQATTHPSTTTPPTTPVQPDGLTGLPANLTAQQIAGQRVIYSYTGLTPPAALLTAIRNGQVGGVIFFSSNISTEPQLAGVVRQLRQAQSAGPVKLPLLLMTDQEGGIVRRLPGAPVPSAKQVGQSPDPVQSAADTGTGAAQNLAGVGLNLNLAPVLDVWRTPGDFIDATQRSYSNNPVTVGQLSSTFIAAQQSHGVAATAKHFPGLGSAPAGSNTDLRPVTLTISATDLRNVDEVPYKAAIGNGVKLVMMSWAVYPSLDANHPAGMSSTIVQNELRGRVGFKGVTITDALEAGAIAGYGTVGNRAISAAGAGEDIILCSSGDVNQGIAATQALAAALGNGQLNKSGFDAAVNRVSALRGTLR